MADSGLATLSIAVHIQSMLMHVKLTGAKHPPHQSHLDPLQLSLTKSKRIRSMSNNLRNYLNDEF